MRDESDELRDLAGVDVRPADAEGTDDHGLVALAVLANTFQIGAEGRVVRETQEDDLAGFQRLTLHGFFVGPGHNVRRGRRCAGVLGAVGDHERDSVGNVGGGRQVLAVGHRRLHAVRHGVIEGRTAAAVELALVVAGVDGTEELEAVDFLHVMVELDDPDHEAVSSRILLARTNDLSDELLDRGGELAHRARHVNGDRGEGELGRRAGELARVGSAELERGGGLQADVLDLVHGRSRITHVMVLVSVVVVDCGLDVVRGLVDDANTHGSHVGQELVGEGLGDGNRGHEVLDDDELLHLLGREVGSDVANRVRHAMRGRLAGDDQFVGDREELEEVRVELGAGVRGDSDVRLHGGVVFGIRVRTFGDVVDHPATRRRPLVEFRPDIRHQIVTGGADQTVGRPDHQRVTPVGLEGADILQIPALLVRVSSAPDALLDVGVADDGERCRVIPLAIDPHAGMRDVNGLMGVEGEVEHFHPRPDAVDELGHAAGVDIGAGDEQRALGVAEVNLPVNAENVDTTRITHEMRMLTDCFCCEGRTATSLSLARDKRDD